MCKLCSPPPAVAAAAKLGDEPEAGRLASAGGAANARPGDEPEERTRGGQAPSEAPPSGARAKDTAGPKGQGGESRGGSWVAARTLPTAPPAAMGRLPREAEATRIGVDIFLCKGLLLEGEVSDLEGAEDGDRCLRSDAQPSCGWRGPVALALRTMVQGVPANATAPGTGD
mmetsp:Transcript_140644/g.449633  ORF Transcript_140644/g.449633 Transcript_140644/m.449633 type:complete len:171 (+) Transcript_140644:229-741(+)